jgi:hypothetical protein
MSLSSLGVRPALLPPAQPARSRTIAPLLPAPVASLPMWRCTLVRDERPSGTCTSTWFAMPPHALRRTVVRGPRVCTMSCLCLTNAGARVIRSRSAAEGQREVVEFKNRLRCANAKLHHTSIGFDSRKIHGVRARGPCPSSQISRPTIQLTSRRVPAHTGSRPARQHVGRQRSEW